MREPMNKKWAMIAKINKQFEEMYHKIAMRYGLSDSNFWVLYALYEKNEPCTQKELCDDWCYTKQTVNSAIKSLEKLGYVKKGYEVNNKTNKKIGLTQSGKQIAGEMIQEVLEIEEKAYSGMKEADLEAAIALLQKPLVLFEKETNQILRKGMDEMNKIVTISREFGSGGREIGKRLAEELGFAYYDKEIITEIAKQTGMTEEYIQNISEKGVYPYTFQFARTFSMSSVLQANQTDVLVAQQKVLKEIASKGNCVIVGRGANVILQEYHPMNLFVYSDMESKINRCKMKRKDEELSDKEIENKILQVDKDRRNYHTIISNIEWGDKKNYHLCINTSGMDVKMVIAPLADYVGKWFERGSK